MSMIKIGVIAVTGILFAVQFKNGKAEYGIYISIAVGLLIFSGVKEYLQEMLAVFRSLNEHLSIGQSYYILIAKLLSISYIGEFASGICRDAGYQAIAAQIEIFGKIIIMAFSTPVILELLESIHIFLQ